MPAYLCKTPAPLTLQPLPRWLSLALRRDRTCSVAVIAAAMARRWFLLFVRLFHLVMLLVLFKLFYLTVLPQTVETSERT